MTPRALFQADFLRIARAAKASGCRAEIRYGEVTVIFIPDDRSSPQNPTKVVDGIDYSPPDL